MSDVSKKEPLFEAREIIGAVGLVALGIGVAQFSWPLALIVVGGILIAVAAGFLK